MSVTVRLPRNLCAKVKDCTVLQVGGGTVGECLAHLVALHPGLKETLFYPGTTDPRDTNPMLRPVVKILVNGERNRSAGLQSQLRDGDNVSIKLSFH